jgi:Ca2+-binding EF-hand superfamily protein
MRVALIAATLALAVSFPAPVSAAQRGGVSGVTANAAPAGSPTEFTITGENPCPTVRMAYGDGTVETRIIRSVPATVSHTYAQPGTYSVRVTGLDGCRGVADTTLRTAVAGAGQQPVDAQRFQAMDVNRDGRITREEWRGSAQSFRVHDWNGDGVLSGDEVRAGSWRQRQGDPDYTPDQYVFNDWTERRFQQMDRNRDGRLTRAEWSYDVESFIRADRNRDGILTRSEFLNSDFDDDRGDQFDYLDMNGDGRIQLNEWHASREAFNWLDRNNDGVLTRAEMAGTNVDSGDQFASLDRNNDRAIELNEWQWSRASFDRLDTNGDGRLSRAEFNSAGPLGTGNTTRTPLTVSSQDRWTDTGIYVEPGQTLSFRATGSIQMSEDGNDIADPQGARSGRRAPNAPLREAPAGALIGRIGNGTPVVLGANGDMRVTRAGRLYLSVNDDELSDNRGEYRVVVTVR